MKYTKLFVFFGALLLIFNTCGKSKVEIENDKKQAILFINKADKLFFENKYSAALSLYLKSIDTYDFNDGVIYYKIGFCYDKGKNDLKNAEKYYNKSLKLLNKSKTNIKYIAANYFNLGIISLKNGNTSQKDYYFSKALPYLKKQLDSGKADGVDLFRIGYYYFDSENYDLATKYFLKSAKVLKKENPFHFYYGGSYFNIGIIYWKNEDINTALYYWKIAVKIDPDNELYKKWYDKAVLIKQASE